MSATASRRSPTLDQSGRPLGPRALATRRRLLDATAKLLGERSVRDVSVVEIAREAETSPATFYQYFKDANEATLVLAEDAAEEMPAVMERLDGAFDGRDGLEQTRKLVDAFMQHWDRYRPVLLIRNLAADEGDRAFMRVRQKAMTPMLERLAARVEQGQRAGRVDPALVPQAAAAALGSILERLAAYHHSVQRMGVSRDELVDTTARIILQTLGGNASGA